MGRGVFGIRLPDGQTVAKYEIVDGVRALDQIDRDVVYILQRGGLGAMASAKRNKHDKDKHPRRRAHEFFHHQASSFDSVAIIIPCPRQKSKSFLGCPALFHTPYTLSRPILLEKFRIFPPPKKISKKIKKFSKNY